MKFTPEARAKAIELARTVNFRGTIARLMRMHPNTLESWLLRGRTDGEGNPIDSHPDVETYVKFKLDFDEARASLESTLGTEVMTDRDWKAKAFTLERAFRHWNPKSILTGLDAGEEMSADTKAAAVHELRAMSSDVVDVMREAWCGSELVHSPAGVRQLWLDVGARYGWLEKAE